MSLYKIRWAIQVALWVAGIYVHMNDECTLDFGCCYPKLRCYRFRDRANLALGRAYYGHWRRLTNKEYQ